MRLLQMRKWTLYRQQYARNQIENMCFERCTVEMENKINRSKSGEMNCPLFVPGRRDFEKFRVAYAR